MATVKFVRLHPEARIPQYQKVGDAGADLYSVERVVIPPGEHRLIPLGFSTEFSPDYEIQIRSRSGITLRNQVVVLNSPGTIDSGFRNEWKVILKNFGSEGFLVIPGSRIAQMVLTPIYKADFLEVSSLEESERGEGGFGSTGVSP